MTEAELERAVIELARWLGYRCAHFGIGLSRRGWRTPARADAVGWPDLVLVGNGRVLYRELKCGRNRLTVEQGEWLEALEAAGCDVGVWRELDWHSGGIEAELRDETEAYSRRRTAVTSQTTAALSSKHQEGSTK